MLANYHKSFVLVVPDKRILKIELLEKELGNIRRKLTLEVKNRDIVKASDV